MSAVKNYSKFTVQLDLNGYSELEQNNILCHCDDIIKNHIRGTHDSNIILFSKDNIYIFVVEISTNNLSYRTDTFNKAFSYICNDTSKITTMAHNKNTLKEVLIDLIKSNWTLCTGPKSLI